MNEDPSPKKPSRYLQCFGETWCIINIALTDHLPRLASVCKKSSSSVPRNRVFSHYATRCGTERVPPLNPASFGKLVRIIFPGIQTRRLGMRGESKYHYVDLSLIEDQPDIHGNDRSQGAKVLDGATDKTFLRRYAIPWRVLTGIALDIRFNNIHHNLLIALCSTDHDHNFRQTLLSFLHLIYRSILHSLTPIIINVLLRHLCISTLTLPTSRKVLLVPTWSDASSNFRPVTNPHIARMSQSACRVSATTYLPGQILMLQTH